MRSLTVRGAREVVGRARRPLWARLYLELWLLAAAAVIFWRLVRSGYQVILAPEGVATISVSYSTFLAPLLFWFGAALLSWRISTAVLGRGGRPWPRRPGRWRAGCPGWWPPSMSRQWRLLSRGLMIMGLTASFAVSTAVFNQTYQQQSRVDAQLTNGADVTAATTAAAGLPAGSFAAARRLPGVAAVQPMMHRFAYVGNDLQDLYGINPRTIGTATPMSDAFFQGGNAAGVLAALASRPDAVLVSAETVANYQLRPGDLLRLRMQSARDHAYHVVPFHYVGVVREFPTAPRDSFFVANASYVAPGHRIGGLPGHACPGQRPAPGGGPGGPAPPRPGLRSGRPGHRHPAEDHPVRPDRARPVRPDQAGAGVRVHPRRRGIRPGAGPGAGRAAPHLRDRRGAGRTFPPARLVRMERSHLRDRRAASCWESCRAGCCRSSSSRS